MQTSGSIKFGGKANYEIRVEGEINPKWQDRFGEMKIEKKQLEANRSVSVLTGPIQDEAALMGILKTLYDLHKVILSVKRLSNNSGENHNNSKNTEV